MTLTIFDLDETLISIDSDHAWGEFLVEKKLVDEKRFRIRNDFFYEQYKMGSLDVHAYLKFACEILTRHPVDDLFELRREFVEEIVRPMILPKALKLIDHHRQQGHCLMVITSTLEFVTAPIVELLAIPHLIAPIPEIKDDRYTGEITGTPSFKGGKLTRLNEWLKDKPYQLDQTCFYSDSINDIPLLEAVGYPIVVDPDHRMEREAQKRGWKIISLRD